MRKRKESAKIGSMKNSQFEVFQQRHLEIFSSETDNVGNFNILRREVVIRSLAYWFTSNNSKLSQLLLPSKTIILLPRKE